MVKPDNEFFLSKFASLNLSQGIGQRFHVGVELFEQRDHLLLVLQELHRLRVRVVAHRKWSFDLGGVLSGSKETNAFERTALIDPSF